MFRQKKENGNGGAAANGGLINLTDIGKTYRTGPIVVEALKGIDLTIRPNEFISIVGPSGSGKSTLMNIIGCLDTPTAGSYELLGEQVSGFSGDKLAEIRNKRIGFVFQNFNLLPLISAYENVEMPLLFKGLNGKERRERVEHLFEQVDLSDRMQHKPTELSGGQTQRVAIARALACEPDIILADEPTGNLDSGAGKDIVHLFEELWEKGHTMVIITHDEFIAKRTRRIVQLHDGAITSDNVCGVATLG